jgi:hypothetical protein
MYKLYTIAKKKTGILGFWQENGKGKIFRDKIKIENCENSQSLNEKIKALFLQGEKAVFYSAINGAFVESASGKLEFLRHKITWQEKKLRPSLVKALLCQHNGLTIFKTEKGFTLELWKA